MRVRRLKPRSYMINEIFDSLQGEGMRAGTANVFVRFSGCNLTCKVESHGFDCDTEFASGRRMTGQEIVDEMNRIGGQCKAVIFTGGEPLLQLDDWLVNFIKRHGWFVAVETNGTRPVPPGIDWVTLSPKVAEHALKLLEANELKYVRGYGQGIPKPKAKAPHLLISPAFEGAQINRRTLKWCIELVKRNPDWRLSVQQHKSWQAR